MEFLKKNNLLIFLTVCFLLYLLFLPNIFNPKFFFWSSDAQYKIFPSRVYFSERISIGEFPFWTERAYLGYPIYQDMELGYLNPINLFFNFLFKTVLASKLKHFFTYLLGCYAFYLLFERYKFNFLGKLTAVVTFYFSFFHLNHLAHQNMVQVSMLLPIHLLFVSYYCSTGKFKYILLQSAVVAYGLLWGQPQITFINIVVSGLFFYFENKNLIKTGFFILVVSTFSLAFSMHQLYPTFSSFILSQRASTSLKYADFNSFPSFLLTNAFPYLFGYYQNYKGVEVSSAFSIIESYNYIGIVGLIGFLFYLLYGSGDKNFKFVLSILATYLILSFINLPLLNYFRYWTRSVFILDLAIGFVLGYLLSSEFSFQKFKWRYFGYLFITLGAFEIISNSLYKHKLYSYFFHFNFKEFNKATILIWVLLLFSTILFFFLRKNFPKKILILNIFLVSILIFDLKYFSMDFIRIRISRFDSPESFKAPDACIDSRCLLLNTQISGYESLLYKSYSPLGYSQFISDDYINYYQDNFADDPRSSGKSEVLPQNLDLTKLGALGFKEVVLGGGNIITLPTNNLDLIDSKISGNYEYKQEGNFMMKLKVPQKGLYDLNIKYSPYWIVKVNNSPVTLEKNGLFSKIYLPEGNVELSAYYFPYDILYGLEIGIVIFILGMLFYTLGKKYSLGIVVSGKDS